MPGFAFPTMGPVGLGSPSYQPGHPCPDLRYYAPLRLPPALLRSLRFSLSFPDTLSRFRSFVSLFRLAAWVGSLPASPRLLVSQYPLSSGALVGRQVALPSSRVVHLNTCPGLGPRWYPGGLPLRSQDCCLPLMR
jgi:hypothetical protein